MTSSDHYFHSCRPYVCSSENSQNKTTFKREWIVITSGRSWDLAERIIDDTCLVIYLLVFQPAEKQLAATTTELASNTAFSALRLLPIMGAFLGIVLVLVLLAVMSVIILRNRSSASGIARNSSGSFRNHSGISAETQLASSSYDRGQCQEEEMLMNMERDSKGRILSPDVIPQVEGKVSTSIIHPLGQLQLLQSCQVVIIIFTLSVRL